MKFILELWPDLGEKATPADYVRYAIQSATTNGENLTWTIEHDDGTTIDVTPAEALIWESAATDEPGDQNATSRRVHGYWGIGPANAGTWSAVLIELDDQSDEVEGGGVDLGTFATELLAKQAAQTYEDKDGEPEGPMDQEEYTTPRGAEPHYPGKNYT